TLRQRLDAAAQTIDVNWNEVLLQESAKLIRKIGATVTSVEAGERRYIPLDIDVSPFDNSGTKKEGVSRTYKGVDGYAPIFAYLGQEGYAVNTELREGSAHSQNGATEFLRESIAYARQITEERLLVRMDAGNDSLENLYMCHAHPNVDYVIKVNLRKSPKEAWLNIAKAKGISCEVREGKTMYIGAISFHEPGFERPLRQVFQVIERSIDRDGQLLLLPELE